MVEQTVVAENELRILPKGECPYCFTKIKIDEPDCTIIKARLTKKYKSGLTLLKCQACKRMVVDD